MTDPPLRIGIHDFLNAQPLLAPLEKKARAGGWEIVTGAPGDIARHLSAGRLDVAMIPSVEYLREADRYHLVPGLSISSHGPVGTVLFVACKPLRQIKTLALDQRSRTSVALLQLMLGNRFVSQVEARPAAPDPEEMLKTHDAALIIGDQALHLKTGRPGRTVFDLSQEWYQRTGKTFVHAVVAVYPRDTVEEAALQLIREIKNPGNAARETIAKTYAREHQLNEAFCVDYLTKKIIYDLGEKELDGLAHFRDLCHETGLIPHKHPIRFV